MEQTVSVPGIVPNPSGIGNAVAAANTVTANTVTAATATVAATTVATAAATVGDSSKLWDQLNAIAIQGLITILLLIIWGVSSTKSNFDDIAENWDKYRCSPTIMPFASFYGHNTAENFSFCMSNIFGSYTGEITAPFSSILLVFTELLGSLMESMDSLRVSASTMGGGINVIFQEFTDRIRNFYFQLRVSAIRIKTLLGRMYAIMFSTMYMGLSAITGATNFGDTSLFSFLDTFCFPPETKIHVLTKGLISIEDVRIGDVLLPTQSIVTTKFHFSAKGQPMVQLPSRIGTDPIRVSTNHYIWHGQKWICAVNHPDAIPIGPYDRHSLICLNTTDHCIPIGGHLFCDYDETSNADHDTLQMIESRVNARLTSEPKPTSEPRPTSEPGPTSEPRPAENSPSFHPLTHVRLMNGSYVPIHSLTTNTVLSTGSRVTGILHKQIMDYCHINSAITVGSATLLWNSATSTWVRASTLHKVQQFSKPYTFVGLIVTPNSQIELKDNLFVRDYMELCSPDAETFYTKELNNL